MRRVVKDLSIFVVDLEPSAHLCLGTVNGGIKYYLLAGDKYTVATHSKKVEVSCPHFYVNAGKSAAYMEPHVFLSALGRTG